MGFRPGYAKTVVRLPPDEHSSATSSSAAFRRFVALSQQQLNAWLQRKLDKLGLPVVMIDGIHFRDSVILVALGIDAKGNKHVLGLRRVPPKPRAWCARCCRT